MGAPKAGHGRVDSGLGSARWVGGFLLPSGGLLLPSSLVSAAQQAAPQSVTNEGGELDNFPANAIPVFGILGTSLTPHGTAYKDAI